jgi:nitrate reductase gamma subunit
MDPLYKFLFIALPYIAVIVFLLGTIYRFKATKFKFSSLSSQFLEGRKLFWGSVPFHWGIILLFFGHLIAFIIPDSVLVWNKEPLRLIFLEVVAFILGLSAFFGLLSLFYRRLTHPRIKVVTNYMDVIIESLLLAQIILGLWTAYGYRWGSSWFASVLTPYLRSIFELNPQIEAVAAMPWVIQLHIVFAFLIVLVIPFTRLVHMLVYPLNYLWRPYQQVVWYWKRKDIRNSKTEWTITKPKNT